MDGILAARADSDEDESEEGEEGEAPEAADLTPSSKEDAAPRSDSTVALRDALKGAGRSTSDPIASYRARTAEAWKRPLTATK